MSNTECDYEHQKKGRDLLSCDCRFHFSSCLHGCNVLLDAPGALCPSCSALYYEEKKRECGKCLQPLQACDCPCKGGEHKGMSHLYKVLPYLPGQADLVSNKLIYAIKDRNLYHAAAFFANELYDTLLFHGCNVSGYEITYIPASKKRMAEQGYNQMTQIAKLLGEHLGLSVSPVLKRTRNAKSQKELKERQRVENTKGLFAVKKHLDLHGRKFILLDDIATTGSTLLSAAKALREAGASHVLHLVIASTVSK